MGFTMAPLLMHSDSVPPAAREALKQAYLGPQEHRDAHLESAARLLCRETELDCGEARELLGLPDGSCG
ncbi:MAG: hypothetical protein H6Q89_2526 [Myxococcaceae bacterium]|jgi:hypothetical protein|nr:hypothetical protein [Myxococcaceae bacterium]